MRRRNLKFYAFVMRSASYGPQLFEVVAPNFTEASKNAQDVAVAAGRISAVYAGLNGSLPGVYEHALARPAVQS